MSETDYIKWFSDISSADLDSVGGKNSSLGEMIRELGESGVRVPNGFATTAAAYREFLDYNEIKDQLGDILKSYRAGELDLKKAGKQARELILDGEFPELITTAIKEAYRQLGSNREADGGKPDVAVRSSAKAEDLPEASFAGQQETFLNISGSRELLNSCRRCYASVFTDRAIAYRHNKGFDDLDLAISVGVQWMVRSDKAGSGVMFSLDTESGFPKVVMVDAVWGLGENIVQGMVTPDEYRVFKPFLDQEGVVPIIEKRLGTKEKTLIYGRGGTGATKNIDTPPRRRKQFVLSDQEVLQLARWACIVEEHYGKPIGKIAASRYPDPVIVRMSDLKTNEYRELIGGEWFEPEEENPMLGFRGASRYYSERYRPAFALECAAIRRVREQLGFVNVVVMIPFCRTLEEADKVLEVMAENNLQRGENGLEVYVMCEIPSNVILAEEFADRFDGFSIGSNDLTQLTLGVDRDLAELSELFDERNEAVKRLITEVIERAHRKGSKVGICGQAPSDYPEFARFLVEAGIDSISLNPDSVIGVRRHLAGREQD